MIGIFLQWETFIRFPTRNNNIPACYRNKVIYSGLIKSIICFVMIYQQPGLCEESGDEKRKKLSSGGLPKHLRVAEIKIYGRISYHFDMSLLLIR